MLHLDGFECATIKFVWGNNLRDHYDDDVYCEIQNWGTGATMLEMQMNAMLDILRDPENYDYITLTDMSRSIYIASIKVGSSEIEIKVIYPDGVQRFHNDVVSLATKMGRDFEVAVSVSHSSGGMIWSS